MSKANFTHYSFLYSLTWNGSFTHAWWNKTSSSPLFTHWHKDQPNTDHFLRFHSSKRPRKPFFETSFCVPLFWPIPVLPYPPNGWKPQGRGKKDHMYIWSAVERLQKVFCWVRESPLTAMSSLPLFGLCEETQNGGFFNFETWWNGPI